MTLKIVSVFSLSLLLQSCAMLYLPNMANVPLLIEQGNLMISANTGFTGYNFQGSYAINNMFFAYLNGAYAFDRGDSSFFNRSSLGEFGFGYYKVLDPKKTVVFESSAGYGYASVDDKGLQGNFYGHISSNYHKFYIQPSIGASTDYFEAALTTRFTTLKYFNFKDFVNPIQSKDYYPGVCAYIEPIATLRAGYKYVKLQIQVGFSLSIKNKHPLALQGFPVLANIGLSGHIPTQKKPLPNSTTPIKPKK
jgi:hypothetical protein